MTRCQGTGCERKNTCKRYREKINSKRDDFFDKVPVKADGRCAFYIGPTENALLEHVKDILQKYPKTKFKDGSVTGD